MVGGSLGSLTTKVCHCPPSTGIVIALGRTHHHSREPEDVLHASCSVVVSVVPPTRELADSGWEPDLDGREASALAGIDPRAYAALRPSGPRGGTRQTLTRAMPLGFAASAKASKDDAHGSFHSATVWSWPAGPGAETIAAAVLHFDVAVADGEHGNAAFKALRPRYSGGGVRIQDGDVGVSFVSFDDFLCALGLERSGNRALAAWVVPWTALSVNGHAHAADAAQGCGVAPGSAHFVADDDDLSFLVRDRATPTDALVRMGVGDPRTSHDAWSKHGKGFGTRLRADWIEPVVLAFVQRCGVDAYRERFAATPRDTNRAAFRAQYENWLGFRHQFPCDLWFESRHSRLAYEHARDHLVVPQLFAGTHEDFALAKDFEQEIDTASTARAITWLTLVAAFFGFLGPGIAIADGLRADHWAAGSGYLMVTGLAVAVSGSLGVALFRRR